MTSSAIVIGPRLLAVLAAPLLVLLATAVPASAHASLTVSDPQAGTVLGTAPTRVVLTFNEVIDPGFAQVQVTGPDSARVDAGAPVVDGTTVTVALQALTAGGVHTVAFRVVSSDNHPVEASFTFDLAPPPAASPPATEAPTPAPPAPSPAQDASSREEPTAAFAALPLPLVLGAVTAVATLGGGVYALVRRRGATPPR